VPGISGFSDEYLLITIFTHKDGPNISARTMRAPAAKTIFYCPKKIILCFALLHSDEVELDVRVLFLIIPSVPIIIFSLRLRRYDEINN
jgi:hypothetical protein